MNRFHPTITVALLLSLTWTVPASAQSSKAANCSTYARNRAEMENSPGSGAIGGAARGAVRGALFGAIIHGKDGAKRGAALGGGLGALGGGARAAKDREARYRWYYDECMRGNMH